MQRLGDSPEKLGNGSVQCFGKSVQSRDRQIFLSALDRPNVGPMQAADSGELLL